MKKEEITKFCEGCKRNLPLKLWRKDKRMKIGVQSKCKKCRNRQNYDRLKNKPEYKKKHNERTKRSLEKYPEKARARFKVRDALIRGDLIKCRCRVCDKLKVQAHHKDYSKPLDVIWLCQQHHNEIHYGKR